MLLALRQAPALDDLVPFRGLDLDLLRVRIQLQGGRFGVHFSGGGPETVGILQQNDAEQAEIYAQGDEMRAIAVALGRRCGSGGVGGGGDGVHG